MSKSLEEQKAELKVLLDAEIARMRADRDQMTRDSLKWVLLIAILLLALFSYEMIVYPYLLQSINS